jgi:hypothetical protein
MATQIPLPEGSGFAYEVGIRSLDEQLRRIEALDSKAGILIAADGLLVGLLLSGDSMLAAVPNLVAGSGLGGVLASLLLALIAFANREYQVAPALPAVIGMMAAPEDWLRWRFVGNLREAVGRNRQRLLWKSRFLTAALVLLFAAVTLLGGYAMGDIASWPGGG